MSSGALKDIDEKFCQCCICLEQFKEPKQLPCIHRFCKGCLAEVMKKYEGKVVCPICREVCLVSQDGVDSFKTDFYMESIIEYIQIQTSLEDDEMRECYGCSKMLKISAYCFKCIDFLCESCYEFHVTSKMMKDHKAHTLAMKEFASENLTLRKLASLKEAPRCRDHPNKLSELSCKSCGSIPICMACTHGSHKDHDFHEVTTLANRERQKLKEKLEKVCSYGETILKLPGKLDTLKDNFIFSVAEKRDDLNSKYYNRERKFKVKIQDINEKFKVNIAEREKKSNEELSVLYNKMEQEIQQVKLKYDKIFDEKRRKLTKEVEYLKRKQDKEASKVQEKLEIFDKGFKESMSSLEKQRGDCLNKIEELTDHFVNTIKRFDNFKATASTILDSMNEWTAVQCIPDICSASQPLIKDMRRKFPETVTLTRIIMKPLPSNYFADQVSISNEGKEVDIDGITAKGWKVSSITSTPERNIVITGNAFMKSSHITVIDETWKEMHQEELQYSRTWQKPDRYCNFLLGSKIVTACDPNEIRVYDVRGSTCIETHLSDVTNNWPSYQGVSCVATDPVNHQIFVGSRESGNVYVLDEKLNYQRSLALPSAMKGSDGIAVSGDNLVVCDFRSKRVVVMSREGAQDDNLMYELTKPSIGGNSWGPFSICTDSNGFIYVLWTAGVCTYGGEHVITQHRRDTYYVVRSKRVDDSTVCLTTLESGDGEKLVTATHSTGKLFLYDLVPSDFPKY